MHFKFVSCVSSSANRFFALRNSTLLLQVLQDIPTGPEGISVSTLGGGSGTGGGGGGGGGGSHGNGAGGGVAYPDVVVQDGAGIVFGNDKMGKGHVVFQIHVRCVVMIPFLRRFLFRYSIFIAKCCAHPALFAPF